MFVIAAGMPRSGSTWLYNVVRILLQRYKTSNVKFTTGWVDDIPWKDSSANFLVKVHVPIDELYKKADLVFYSYRDLRDVLASHERKFATYPTVELANTFLKSDKSNYSMKYESMMAFPEKVIEAVCDVLQLQDIDFTEVLNQVNQLNYQADGDKNDRYHKANLYHSGHITNGHEGSWKGQLSDSLIRELESLYGDWFIKHQYLISN